ncbi:MAG TPA: hypothetical protein VKE40_10565 [Gemmataceae bacterium]|nr:hypothetical protein [Gemmataceae bacterium]
MRRFLAVLAIALPLAAGCSRGPATAQVSGRVTLNGQPLANVHVSFQPIAAGNDYNVGGGSYAITDADGKFTLRLVDGEKLGAVVGKHRVEITPRNTDDDLDRRGKGAPTGIPERYNRNTTLTFEVPAKGTDQADFPLTAP